MASFSSLPQELVDRIADELYCEHPSVDEEARKALLACALVSKSLYEGARRHLLSEVSIHDRDSMNVALHRRLKLYPDTPDRLRSLRLHVSFYNYFFTSTRDLLLSLLANPLNVKHLSILRSRSSFGGRSSEEQFSRLFKELLSVAGSLIDRAQFFSTINTLQLRLMTLTVRNLAAFKSLRTLVLEDCNFRDDESSNTREESKVLVNYEAFKSLEVLSVSSSDSFNDSQGSEYALPVLSKPRIAFSSLRTLCWVGEYKNLQAVPPFLRDYEVLTNLVKLDLTVEIKDSYGTLDSQAPGVNPGYRLDLSALPKLRDLKLKWVLPAMSAFLQLQLRRATIFSILRPSRSMPSIKVKNLHLSLSMPYASEDKQLNAWKDIEEWDLIDQMISDAFLYPVLRTFRFSLVMRATQDQEDEAQLKLPIFANDLPLHFSALNNRSSIRTSFDAALAIGSYPTQAPPLRPPHDTSHSFLQGPLSDLSHLPFSGHSTAVLYPSQGLLPGIPHSQATSLPSALLPASLPPSTVDIGSEDDAYYDDEEEDDPSSGEGEDMFCDDEQ